MSCISVQIETTGTFIETLEEMYKLKERLGVDVVWQPRPGDVSFYTSDGITPEEVRKRSKKYGQSARHSYMYLYSERY